MPAENAAPESVVSHDAFFSTVLTLPAKLRPMDTGSANPHEVRFANGVQAVVKREKFSNHAIHGVPLDTLCKREAAAYQLDYKILNWHIVPPTTLTVWKHSSASIQAYVYGVHADEVTPHVWQGGLNVAKFCAKVNVGDLRRCVLFDLIINNQHRHDEDLLFDTMNHHAWAIDNGLSFGPCFDGYDNVFHRTIFRQNLLLTVAERDILATISEIELQEALKRYLQPREITMVWLRIRWMLDQKNLGWQFLQQDGADAKRKAWFKRKMRRGEPNLVLRQAADMEKRNSLPIKV